MNKIEKKRIVQTILFLGTFISLFYVPWILVKAWLIPLPDTVKEQVNEAIHYGFDGIIVYVDEVGKPPAYYTAGWHDRKNKIPTKPNALFKVASISKLYVAVAITKLVHENQISLDRSLASYFPEIIGKIEHADKITIRMMVQHRSGIPNYTATQNYWMTPKENNEERLELILNLPANFKPDEDFEYCNTNYLLLSELIDKITGKTAFHYIKEKILNPLNLKNTFGSISEINMDNLMSGYYVGIENDIKTDNNGSILATADDLGVFLRALNNGTVFGKGEQETYASLYKFEHAGLIPGYQSIAKYHKDLDAVVIQFTNTTNFDGYNWNLSEIIYSRIIKILKKNK